MKIMKSGDHIRPGDVIHHVGLGGPHVIERIDSPTAETLAIMPASCGYAVASDGWAITLDPSMQLEVALSEFRCLNCHRLYATEAEAQACEYADASGDLGRCEECCRAITASEDAALGLDVDFVEHHGHLIRRVREATP